MAPLLRTLDQLAAVAEYTALEYERLAREELTDVCTRLEQDADLFDEQPLALSVLRDALAHYNNHHARDGVGKVNWIARRLWKQAHERAAVLERESVLFREPETSVARSWRTQVAAQIGKLRSGGWIKLLAFSGLMLASIGVVGEQLYGPLGRVISLGVLIALLPTAYVFGFCLLGGAAFLVTWPFRVYWRVRLHRLQDLMEEAGRPERMVLGYKLERLDDFVDWFFDRW